MWISWVPGLRWVSGIFAMRFRTQTVVKKNHHKGLE